MPDAQGKVESVNTGRPRPASWRGKTIQTAIWKTPVSGRVPIADGHVGDDRQADIRYHGGVDKALYAYALEDYGWWAGELGRELEAASFGENLTTSGVDLTRAEIGAVWRVGTATLEVSEPRIPCFKLGLRMEDNRFPKRFGAASRPGAYLRILEEGDVEAGDGIEIRSTPGHGVTVGTVFDARMHDADLAPRLLEAPQLSDEWRDWAEKAAQRTRSAPA